MMEIRKSYFLGVFVAVALVGLSYYLWFDKNRNLFYFMCVASLIVSLLPFVFAFLSYQKDQKEKETKFLEFTRDLVEGVKSGTPINKAIVNLQGKDYGSLTLHIRKLANQISFGINLDQAFSTFSKETGSKVISRAMMLISQAQKAGGRIDTIIQSVSQSVNQIEDIRKERASSVYNLIIQGYIIFFVFIVIMLVLEYAILPLAVEFSQNQVEGLNAGDTETLTKKQFSTPLFVMLLVQAIFAGLVIGQISEGNFLSGIKHSFLLTTITLTAVTGTRALLG